MAEPISDIDQLLADLEQNQFPPHIAELSVKDRIKRAFTLFERCGAIQPFGLIPSLPKDIMNKVNTLGFKQKYALNKILLVNIWWCIFFGPLYYFAVGMWRKGLILLCGVFFLAYMINVLFMVITDTGLPRHMNTPISFGFGYVISMAATYDLYRQKVKKEVFWW